MPPWYKTPDFSQPSIYNLLSMWQKSWLPFCISSILLLHYRCLENICFIQIDYLGREKLILDDKEKHFCLQKHNKCRDVLSWGKYWITNQEKLGKQSENHLAKVTKKAFNSIILLSMQGNTILHLLPFNYVFYFLLFFFCNEFLSYRRNVLGGLEDEAFLGYHHSYVWVYIDTCVKSHTRKNKTFNVRFN